MSCEDDSVGSGVPSEACGRLMRCLDMNELSKSKGPLSGGKGLGSLCRVSREVQEPFGRNVRGDRGDGGLLSSLETEQVARGSIDSLLSESSS